MPATPPDPTAPPPRRRHLMDPDAPRPVRDPGAEQRLLRVQRWVMSVLAVSTILHFAGGLVLLAAHLPDLERTARTGLTALAGVAGVVAVGAGRAIHGRRPVSWWLLLGLLPGLVGLWLVLV